MHDLMFMENLAAMMHWSWKLCNPYPQPERERGHLSPLLKAAVLPERPGRLNDHIRNSGYTKVVRDTDLPSLASSLSK